MIFLYFSWISREYLARHSAVKLKEMWLGFACGLRPTGDLVRGVLLVVSLDWTVLQMVIFYCPCDVNYLSRYQDECNKIQL